MKKLIILLTVVFLSACGGSTDTATSPSTSPDTLPDIVDNYSDGLFKYANPFLYVGQYNVDTSEFPDTCSNLFGGNIFTTVEIISISENQLTIYDNSNNTQVTLPAFQGNFDAYTYEWLFSNAACYISLTSLNSNNTLDLAYLECQTITYESCQTATSRASAYDFTGETIKSGDTTPVDAIKRMNR